MAKQAAVGTFSTAGLGPADYERSWNEWVGELYARGLRPADEPVGWTEETVTYLLHPVSSRELNGALLAGLVGMAVTHRLHPDSRPELDGALGLASLFGMA